MYFLVVDFHGEITSEKMAAGHFFDGRYLCCRNTYAYPHCRYVF